MGVARTKTVKNKHATRGSGIKNSKAASKIENDPVVKARKTKEGRKAPVKPGQLAKELQKKRKRKVYSEKDLGIPELNMVTPIGVEKPKGKKKGKVFVDDRESLSMLTYELLTKESMNTILSMVQAEKDGQIESKMMKARHMEAIREARKQEAEKKANERKEKLDETKDSLRKKRKRPERSEADDDKANERSMRHVELQGTKAAKPKKKKRVSFIE